LGELRGSPQLPTAKRTYQSYPDTVRSMGAPQATDVEHAAHMTSPALPISLAQGVAGGEMVLDERRESGWGGYGFTGRWPAVRRPYIPAF
jgi:hypothetical protein